MTVILLVEDNEMNRDMLTRRLQRRDFDVITADNGGTAVELAMSENLDLILRLCSILEICFISPGLSI